MAVRDHFHKHITFPTNSVSNYIEQKYFIFSFVNSPIDDVTSTLTITVKDESIINTMKDGTLGKISIPLLTIVNDEKAWFDLSNRPKKSVLTKGNSPKIQLQMSIAWNPVICTFIASNILGLITLELFLSLVLFYVNICPMGVFLA